MSPPPHVLLITFPSQGHINPALQFAKRLLAVGARVTFVTTASAYRRMATPTREGLTFASIPDDWSIVTGANGMGAYMDDLKRRGPLSLAQIAGEAAHPVTCVVYCTLLPWVARAARELHLPAVLLWNQAAAVLAIYYHCFHGVDIEDTMAGDGPDNSLKFPGLPALARRDLPSFFVDKVAYPFALGIMEDHVKALDEEKGQRNSRPTVLINTFDALEQDALTSVPEYKMVAVGPLIPSAFLDGKDPNDRSFGGDLFQVETDDYIGWLDSRPEKSVVYLSFGSISVFSNHQTEELARALLDAGLPFLWVWRRPPSGEEEKGEENDGLGSYREELERVGKIVPWCSQVEVLSHPAVGCFVTHCGWNSTFESLAAGVPVVGFPQWTDQMTNAKMVEGVWRTGIRVEVGGDGVLESGELRRCLELVMGGGERGVEMRRNAEKWKELAREAWMEGGGSSYTHLKAFVDEVASAIPTATATTTS